MQYEPTSDRVTRLVWRGKFWDRADCTHHLRSYTRPGRTLCGLDIARHRMTVAERYYSAEDNVCRRCYPVE